MHARKRDLEALNKAISFAVGAYAQCESPMTLEQLKIELRSFENALAIVIQFLSEPESGITNLLKFRAVAEVVNDLVTFGFDSNNAQAKNRLGSAELSLTPIMVATRAALERSQRTSSPGGRPRKDWYDFIAVAARDIAERNHIRPSVTTDPETGEKKGPFLYLVRGIEAFLPENMRSRTDAACAQRLERAKKIKDPRRAMILASIR